MKMRFRLTIACIGILVSLQCISCDEQPQGPGLNKWICSCASTNRGNATYSIAANCSTLCDCNPGSAGEPKVASKRITNKVVVYVLLLSVGLTTLAFLASLGCYVYRRDKYPMQPPIFSSDKDTSCNSATNLISHASTSTSSVSTFKLNTSSSVNPLSGCIRKVSFMFRTKSGTLPGTIYQFSYTELELATHKFDKSNLIGLGGSSHVYRGQLKDGRTVAIKRLKTQGGPDADNVFLTEIELISRLHHCHIIPLLGYCSESQGKQAERLIVFEYMPNGNLRDCLDEVQGKEPMDWVTRIRIALGAARGLEYLHEAAAPRILHRDVKSTNILLDDKWRAKITDLGMAKRLKTDDLQSAPTSPARMQGTFGYFAPEYAIIGRASLKSDVFSFGVVLLELISGRHPIHKSPDKGDQSLVIWAAPRLKDSKRVISELADPLLKGNYPEEEMQVMAYLAKECLLLDPDFRPSMSEVVQILSTISPDKSRRRSFPVNLFQNSLNRSMRSLVEIEKTDEHTENSTGSSMRATVEIEKNDELTEKSTVAEELKRTTSERWSPRCSLPLSLDRTLCISDNSKDGEVALSADYMERLVLLTSKGRSWRAHPDDETVDLTEPRFESFLQANVLSV
ncbi:receptor-like serine/threonine-protein kinase NCRK isoform X3 [Papaver somniferum]|uniref:receptor-like serine/threonine-protein kinase NCRK isoform X3 n=1 Tax=Papaver somniferum TaxID=3469 RepID=UPI000E705655|nr:receptor-like serine/threonine-protein kinase NCRK isoform X3 [Papaver somniferum]